MINLPNNWGDVKPYEASAKLPKGAYICIIMDAIVKMSQSNKPMLEINFDIFRGEYTDYFANKYNAEMSNNGSAKWKGVIRQMLPLNDGSEEDKRTISRLKGVATAIENSNRGFIFGNDERALKGKVMGVIFRDEEWEFNGNHGWTAKPFRICSTDKVEDGTAVIPDDKYLESKSNGIGNYSASSNNYSGFGGYSAPSPQQAQQNLNQLNSTLNQYGYNQQNKPDGNGFGSSFRSMDMNDIDDGQLPF